MDKHIITIVTGTGGHLGTGHFQRMLNLAVHLNRDEKFSAAICLQRNDFPVEKKFSHLIIDSVNSVSSLIIRDMRDSTPGEIRLLKKTAPVLVIDDSGEGGASADYAVSLLPLPGEKTIHVAPDNSMFIYGYNFTEGIAALERRDLPGKDIDVSIYAGYDPSPELLSSVMKSVPQSACSVLLRHGRGEKLTGNPVLHDASYSEIIARSKIVITHFGLTMYEADACGCRIAALNPTPYHSSLTDIIIDKFNIIYSGEYSQFSSGELKKIIDTELKNNNSQFSINEILDRINIGTGNFIKCISEIINTSFTLRPPHPSGRP